MSNKFDETKFKMGYVICYMNPGDWLGNLIVNRQFKAGFSHEAAQITHVEISGGGKHSINISPPFSKLIDITKRHKGRFAYLLRYKNADYELKGRFKVAYFSASLCNMGYDIPGILRFLFNWIGQDNRLWFCSEGCAWALQKVYSLIFNGEKPCNIMPAHFLADKEFEKIWQGYIL